MVAHSGYIPEEMNLTFRWRELGGTEFFVAHGIHDPIIPIHLAQRAQELLTQAEARVTYKEYPMAHQITEESLADVSAWLQWQIDRGTDK
jgi:phospholipase/carboxylesterase